MLKPSWSQRIPIALLFLLTLALLACGVVAWEKPTAALNVGYKIGVLALASLYGWWLDHVLLAPYARPAGYLAADWRERRGRLSWDFRQKEKQALQIALADQVSDFPILQGHSKLFIAANQRRAFVVVGTMIAAALVL